MGRIVIRLCFNHGVGLCCPNHYTHPKFVFHKLCLKIINEIKTAYNFPQ